MLPAGSKIDCKVFHNRDYGKAGTTNELNVSNLVKAGIEFVITVGDNNYELGEQSTIDANIGQYYRFIFPLYRKLWFRRYGQQIFSFSGKS